MLTGVGVNMSWAIGMSWLHHKNQHKLKFRADVPGWVCCLVMSKRVGLVRSALRLGWRMPVHSLFQMNFTVDHGVFWGNS